MKIQTKTHYFDEPLYLESGRVFSKFHLAYETYGELNSDKSNVIVITHALTGSAHAAGRYENESKAGWWDSLIGDGKAVDTSKFFVICINILSSPFGSTCPLDIDDSTGMEYRTRFPVLVISDVVKAQVRLLSELGISRVKAVIGGSLGGMQALCYAIEYPNFAENIFALATTYATQPWAIAFNKIAISAIKSDPNFKGGYYDKDEIAKNGLNGMAVGRMAGHISFLSPASMNEKFGRNYVETDGLYELDGRFQVDRYLDYNGVNFSHRFDPLCYLYIAKMMNLFDCTRHYGSLKNAMAQIRAKLFLISFSGDILFPPNLMEEMYKCMIDLGAKERVFYTQIDSDYGHDAFLVEVEKFDYIIKRVLDAR
ncbi:homoserine O-acetyltransferase [Campylobacter sp. JMF_04 NA10]|uniref:homoserine O-acetyltransferase MetX n=1 Tax=Campylobacter sp. JMF_04 NA10 TaxID=2983824 RepID=UPI0022EA09BD|nr:homoserine O-acetyltransferase [Campylobacter sp. JMF_04 NA10]MDA3077146.1 homoserine O-acetyltransferase [Campylobacter sp. JMF_04 NA10]